MSNIWGNMAGIEKTSILTLRNLEKISQCRYIIGKLPKNKEKYSLKYP